MALYDGIATTWKSDVSEENELRILQNFSRFSTTVWLHPMDCNEKCRKKNLDWKYTRMPRALFNQVLKDHRKSQQLYSYLNPISQTIQVTKHAQHCCGSKDELKSNVFLWNPTHIQPLKKTYIYEFLVDTGCHIEVLQRAMIDREEWRERVERILLSALIDDGEWTNTHSLN